MSQQQADGLKPSDWQVEEEGHGMHCKPHEKLNTHIFLSSKNNNIVNSFHNSFIDDDLVTWLQYPLDDDSCPDIFQHWPPPSSPAPAAPGGSSTPPSASKDRPPQEKNAALMVNIAVSCTTSSATKDPLPQEKNEALTVNIASDDRPPTACEGNMQIDTDQKTKAAPSTEVSHQEGSTTQAVLEQRDGGSQQGNLHKTDVAHTATLRAGGVHGDSCKHDNERESVAKDCRKPAHMKLSPHEEVRSWAREAYLAAHVNTESKHSFAEAIAVDTVLDNKMMTHTTQFKHSPQDERGQGLRNMDSTHLRFPAEGSSSGEKLQKEASANPPHRKEETCVQKDSSRKLSFITDSAQAVNTQTNPSAEAALALGAGRAAGVIRPSGTEAFSKVRTSLQPICPAKFSSYPSACALSPTSPSYFAGYPPPMLPPRGRAFGFRDVNLAIQPAQQNNEAKLQNAAQPQLFRPCANMRSIAPQEHHRVNPMNGGSNNNDDHSSKDSLLESSTTALLGSQGTKGMSVMFKQVPSAEQAKEGANVGGGRVFYGMDACDMQKLSGPPLLHREKREDFAFSGGSETSESLKEAISGTKRMLEDSECQSEDAEGGESPVNSQSRSSGSKRTRANEVHNLSERRRRNRINDKMNALRDLIPNASKSNKAALLDEAIDYLKNLQLQLQVMSLRTGVSLSPMVVPPGLPHMQTPQARPFHTVGIGMTGGSTGGVAYGVPARPLGNLTSSEPRMLQPSENSSLTVSQSAPLNFPHSFVQSPSQPIFPVNMDMYNTYFQQQQFQQQQQQQLQQHLQHQEQQLQQHLQHQEQLASPQVQASSLPLPSSHQQSHYQL